MIQEEVYIYRSFNIFTSFYLHHGVFDSLLLSSERQTAEK